MPRTPRRRALLAPAVATLLLAGLVGIPGPAAAFTSTGARCTVVGTPGPDVLRGTPGRDVICGRGGDDVIRAGGGPDLVDAGAGDDRVRAGGGADEVVGGDGGDRVLGGGGRDDLDGGGGRDTLSGGRDDDLLDGGDRGDDLNGGGGDDELTSGDGVDDVDGGPGDNLCIVDAEDESVRCRYDEQPPVLARTEVVPGAVDVTHADAEVVVRVHATDDTGVTIVQAYLTDRKNRVALSVDGLEPVAGTDRDGWWQGTVVVPRHTAPGPLYAEVSVTDRHGRSAARDEDPPVLHVDDADPDTEVPGVTLERLTPAAVDVRAAARDLTVRVRVTDAKAGLERLSICLDRPGTPTRYNPHPLFEPVDCEERPRRLSGGARDGVWQATLTVPHRSVGATYNVSVRVEDRASNRGTWYGPDAHQQYVKGRWCCTRTFPLPDDAGRVEVTGAVADATPAWVEAVIASRTELDTLEEDDVTRVRVFARDEVGEGEGVRAVSAVLLADTDLAAAPQFAPTDLQLVDGTVSDGWWEGDVVAPRGTPPGTYHLLVGVSDRAHAASYTDPTAPGADGVSYQPLEGVPVITVVDRRR